MTAICSIRHRTAVTLRSVAQLFLLMRKFPDFIKLKDILALLNTLVLVTVSHPSPSPRFLHQETLSPPHHYAHKPIQFSATPHPAQNLQLTFKQPSNDLRLISPSYLGPGYVQECWPPKFAAWQDRGHLVLENTRLRRPLPRPISRSAEIPFWIE